MLSAPRLHSFDVLKMLHMLSGARTILPRSIAVREENFAKGQYRKILPSNRATMYMLSGGGEGLCLRAPEQYHTLAVKRRAVFELRLRVSTNSIDVRVA